MTAESVLWRRPLFSLLWFSFSSKAYCFQANFCIVTGVGEAYLCQHGGSCHDVGATHRCSCTAGFTGSYCETDINECGSDPCLNGATCNDYLNRFV